MSDQPADGPDLRPAARAPESPTAWPGDPATPRTPVAATRGDVVALARDARSTADLDARVSVCRACPRLVEWREAVARDRRRAFADQAYWGRPLPGWGAADPAVLIVGLAPAAHGGNRTGRIFTGDRSGDWLFASLHRAGLAALPTSSALDDGQQLRATRIVAAVRCAPPANRPTVQERDTCAPWLHREVRLVLPSVRVVVALGGFAWTAALGALTACGLAVPQPRPAFGHAVEVAVPHGPVLLGSYHPSQQNTFTGRLTVAMLDAVTQRAAELAGA